MAYSKFTWSPDSTVSHSQTRKTLVTSFENGKKKWYSKGSRPRTWKLTFNNRDYSEIQDILAFWNGVSGAGTAFEIDL